MNDNNMNTNDNNMNTVDNNITNTIDKDNLIKEFINKLKVENNYKEEVTVDVFNDYYNKFLDFSKYNKDEQNIIIDCAFQLFEYFSEDILNKYFNEYMSENGREALMKISNKSIKKWIEAQYIQTSIKDYDNSIYKSVRKHHKKILDEHIINSFERMHALMEKEQQPSSSNEDEIDAEEEDDDEVQEEEEDDDNDDDEEEDDENDNNNNNKNLNEEEFDNVQPQRKRSKRNHIIKDILNQPSPNMNELTSLAIKSMEECLVDEACLLDNVELVDDFTTVYCNKDMNRFCIIQVLKNNSDDDYYIYTRRGDFDGNIQDLTTITLPTKSNAIRYFHREIAILTGKKWKTLLFKLNDEKEFLMEMKSINIIDNIMDVINLDITSNSFEWQEIFKKSIQFSDLINEFKKKHFSNDTVLNRRKVENQLKAINIDIVSKSINNFHKKVLYQCLQRFIYSYDICMVYKHRCNLMKHMSWENAFNESMKYFISSCADDISKIIKSVCPEAHQIYSLNNKIVNSSFNAFDKLSNHQMVWSAALLSDLPMLLQIDQSSSTLFKESDMLLHRFFQLYDQPLYHLKHYAASNYGILLLSELACGIIDNVENIDNNSKINVPFHTLQSNSGSQASMHFLQLNNIPIAKFDHQINENHELGSEFKVADQRQARLRYLIIVKLS